MVESTSVTPKKNLPVWAIVMLVMLALCILCFGILVVSGVLVTINPSKSISKARNTQTENRSYQTENQNAQTEDRNAQRRKDVSKLYDAVSEAYSEDADLSSIPTCISTPKGKPIGSGTGIANLAPILVPKYISELPLDPQGGTSVDTGYSICMDETENGMLRILATQSENGYTIVIQTD